MTQKVLVFEQSRCIGCRLCEQWCSITHFDVVNPAKTCIKISRDHRNQLDMGIICHQCADAPCVASCKFDALSRHPETGAVMVDPDKCTGCRMCVRACPHGAVSMHPEEKYVLICDLCGGDPQCVKHCPEQAVQYLEPGKADRPYRSALLKNRAAGGESNA